VWVLAPFCFVSWYFYYFIFKAINISILNVKAENKMEATVSISKHKPEGKGTLDCCLYRKTHFRKPRTRNSPTRSPETMDAYMTVWLVPGRKEQFTSVIGETFSYFLGNLATKEWNTWYLPSLVVVELLRKRLVPGKQSRGIAMQSRSEHQRVA